MRIIAFFITIISMVVSIVTIAQEQVCINDNCIGEEWIYQEKEYLDSLLNTKYILRVKTNQYDKIYQISYSRSINEMGGNSNAEKVYDIVEAIKRKFDIKMKSRKYGDDRFIFQGEKLVNDDTIRFSINAIIDNHFVVKRSYEIGDTLSRRELLDGIRFVVTNTGMEAKYKEYELTKKMKDF